jgi:hypothetical protein
MGPSLSGLYESPCPRGGDRDRGRPIGDNARLGGDLRPIGDKARRGGDLARSSRAERGGGEPAGRYEDGSNA